MIMMAGMCLVLFVSFNYAFNSEGGLKERLWESANKSLDGEQKTRFDNLMPQLTQGFGVELHRPNQQRAPRRDLFGYLVPGHGRFRGTCQRCTQSVVQD